MHVATSEIVYYCNLKNAKIATSAPGVPFFAIFKGCNKKVSFKSSMVHLSITVKSRLSVSSH